MVEWDNRGRQHELDGGFLDRGHTGPCKFSAHLRSDLWIEIISFRKICICFGKYEKYKTMRIFHL